jgi:hypothetical protein
MCCSAHDGEREPRQRGAVIARSVSDEAIQLGLAARWIASRSLSSGARSRDPLARNDEVGSSGAAKQPDGQITSGYPKSCQAPRAKIFRLTRRANHLYDSAHLTRERGGSRSSRTLRWDAVDARVATDERNSSGRTKSCGPDASGLASSRREAKLLADDGDKKIQITGVSAL